MTEVLLVLVMYCGVPVAATIAYPTPEGPKIIVGPIAQEARATMLANADAIKAAGGRVEYVKVEAQVEGLKCPVAASNELPPLYMKPRYPVVRNDDEDATPACESRKGCWF